MRRRLIALAAVLCSHDPTAAAAGPGAVRLTVDEAVARALSASARIAALESRRAAEAAGRAGAAAERLPVLELGASYAKLSDVPEVSIALPGGGSRTIFPNVPDRYSGALAVEVPLYTGGRVDGAVRAARSSEAAAGKDLAAATADLVRDTRAVYWRLVAARETERVLGESLASYEAHLRDVTARRDVGLAAENDVLAVRVDRDRAELGRIEAEGAARVADAALARLLDLPWSSRFEPAEPLELPAEPVADLDALVDAALEARPEIAALAARIASAEAAGDVERAARRPRAGAFAAYEYANPNLRVLPLEARWDDSWQFGVGLAWRLADGGRTAHAVARSRAEAEALRAEREDLERAIGLDVTARREELVTARAGVRVAERNLEAARENRRVTADRFREGLIPSSELLDAETRLLRAGLDRTRTLTEAALAWAALERALGR